jgi:hypothetical protein
MNIDGIDKRPLNVKYGSGETGIGLVVGCHANRAFGVVCSVVMVVERLYQRGEKEEYY